VISKNTPLTYIIFCGEAVKLSFRMENPIEVIEENEIEDTTQPRLILMCFEKILKFIMEQYFAVGI
jgi:hypothetical protein